MNLTHIKNFKAGALALVISTILSGCGGSDKKKVTEPTKPTTPDTTKLQKQLEAGFPQATSVFGISIRGTSNTPSTGIKHAANVMAQYLDNDEDGIPDNQAIVDKLVEKKATLIISSTESELEQVFDKYFTDELVKNAALQDLYISEMHPKGEDSGNFDATLEEVLHLITHEGYADVYPEIFGEKKDSAIADAMDIARGGYFETIPTSYPESAWYRYDDETCEYDCMVTEYTYWALTSILGAQEFDGRLDEIKHEWQLNTKDKVQAKDTAVFDILTNGSYALASILPDGQYDALDFEVSGAVVDTKKADTFSYITEQGADSIAVYGSKSVGEASYQRALADVKDIVDFLNEDVRQGLFNSGVKMLVVENEDELESNIDYFMSLLPVEAIFTNNEGEDETLVSDERAGLSNTKLEMMYLVVYYSLLTESELSEQYLALQNAYQEAHSKGLFNPDEAYQDGYVDEIHQNASDKNALKYGSYLYNLAKVAFGNQQGISGEFTLTTTEELMAENPLGYEVLTKIFAEDDGETENTAKFTFKDNNTSSDTVFMNGVIGSDTLDVMKKLFNAYPQIKLVVMQNVPGSMDDEINLLASREIRNRGIATHIPADGMVASGGTDMFLAGTKRTIELGAKLGVHSWSDGDKGGNEYPRDHEEHAKYLGYYKEMGIASEFYWYTLDAADADDIHWMTESEIVQYGVLTD
jgi:hypothetical protein